MSTPRLVVWIFMAVVAALAADVGLGTRLSGEAHTVSHDRARRQHGPRGAHRRAGTHGQRGLGRGRGQSRQHDRGIGHGSQGAARWLQHTRHYGRSLARGVVPEDALRSGEGFCADHAGEPLAQHPGRASRAAREVRQGIDRARQGPAGRVELRRGRDRRFDPPVIGTVQGHGGRQHRARSLQEHRRGRYPPHQRPVAAHVRHHGHGDDAHQVGQIEGAGDQHRAALPAGARSADGSRRGKPAGFRVGGDRRRIRAGWRLPRRSSNDCTRRSAGCC